MLKLVKHAHRKYLVLDAGRIAAVVDVGKTQVITGIHTKARMRKIAQAEYPAQVK